MEENLGKILNAKYEKADLEKVVSSYDHLNTTDKTKLLQLLQHYESLFDGTLGTWRGSAYDIELKANATPYHSRAYNIKLKPDAAPYHARAYNIPKSVEKTTKIEVDRLCGHRLFLF